MQINPYMFSPTFLQPLFFPNFPQGWDTEMKEHSINRRMETWNFIGDPNTAQRIPMKSYLVVGFFW